MSTTNSAGWDAGTSMHPAIGDEPEREQIDCGDAAFPTANGQFFGMSLRDYFAGIALTVMLQIEGSTYETDAAHAYKAADAMIKARNA